MTVELASKVAEKTFSDKYFKWAALGGAGLVVAGTGVAGYLIYRKMSELNPKNWFSGLGAGIGDFPAWLLQQGAGGLSPLGAVSPLMGLLELLGLRDQLQDDTITDPADLLRCDSGKPSYTKALLTALNPELGLLWARACKKAKEDKDTEAEEKELTALEIALQEAKEREDQITAKHYQEMADLRAADEKRWREHQELLRRLEQRNAEEKELMNEKLRIANQILRTGEGGPTAYIPSPVVPWWQEIFEDLAGMEWKEWKEEVGRQAVNDFLDPITLGYSATNEQRVMAWYHFTRNMDLRPAAIIKEEKERV